MNLKSFFRILLVCVVLSTAVFLLVRERGMYTFWHSNVTRLNSDKGAKLIEEKAPFIIDARSAEEYETSHLAGAMRFENGLVDSLSKDTPILIYCTVGVRSNSLANILSEQGFNQVYELKRGILGWSNARLPVMDNRDQLTDEIHVYSEFFSSFLKEGKAIY